jgi:hypothetical protein
MGLRETLNKIMIESSWEELQLRARKRTRKDGKPLTPLGIKKQEVCLKIRDFSRDKEGLLKISNSERKKLIEQEVELNKKKE